MLTDAQNRPAPETKTGRVWAIADEITKRTGRRASRDEVIRRFVAEGGNRNTASTQYHHWKSAQNAAAAAPAEPGDHPAEPVPIGPDGALVIPESMRRAMGLSGERQVSARVVDGELRVIGFAAGIRRAQAIVRKYDRGTGSIVDELIADRRAEAARE